MIDAKELKIGNFVSHYEDIIQVDGIDDIDVFNRKCGEVPLHCIKPIGLTEEWLLKFGFEKIPNALSLKLKEDWFLAFEFGSNEFFLTINGGSDNMELKYVHQLQNLCFALTGEELTTKQ